MSVKVEKFYLPQAYELVTVMPSFVLDTDEVIEAAVEGYDWYYWRIVDLMFLSLALWISLSLLAQRRPSTFDGQGPIV